MITLRPVTPADEPFLREMLYQAIYTPPGAPLPARQIIDRPELRRYVENWGAPGDLGIVAEDDGVPVGAAWLRLLTGHQRGYGHVNDGTPELTIAVLPQHRNRGIGGQLLAQLLGAAAHVYPTVSLSVAAGNPARRLYERHGFHPLDPDDESLTMVRHFGEPPDLAAISSA